MPWMFLQLLSDSRSLQACLWYLHATVRLLLLPLLSAGETTTRACSQPVQTTTSGNYGPNTRMQPAHVSSRGRPVWSANLKRKTRSWWGAEGPVQRRPVEGCRAEKILRSDNKTKNTRQKQKRGKEGRKRGEERDKKTWTVVSEWVRRKVGYLRSFPASQTKTSLQELFKQEGLGSLTENTALNRTNCDRFYISRNFCLFCEDDRK